MHIDPEYTDAFNALISGEKWWVSLPKDLYEFNDEFTCIRQCSDDLKNFQSKIGIWFSHMLPQIRYYLVCFKISTLRSLINSDTIYL